MQTDPDQKPKNVLPELIIPALALVFTLYYLTTIIDVPWIAQASAFTVSGLLLVSIIAFSIRTAIRLRAGTEVISIKETRSQLSSSRRITIQRLILLALTLGYVFMLPSAGFTLSTFIFVFCSTITLSSTANWPRAMALALTCSIIGYIVFIYLFKTRFPFGVIENFLKGVL